MKKFKKLLAGLLAGAMMLGSMTTTAFAEGGTGTATAPVSTIDKNAKASLTIHKYYFLNNQPDNLQPGTGEAVADSKLPEGASALIGAEFSIWKIADVEGNVTISGKTNETFKATGDLAKDAASAETYINGVDATATGTTDDNGIVKFDNNGNGLDFGIYYVKETKTPANISSTPSKFVVSVPMTSQKTDAGAKWIYDVHVYPKNVKTEAGITIKKIDANKSDISGTAEFVLRKKNGANEWKYVKVISENDQPNSYDYDVTDFNDATKFIQNASISGLGHGSYRLFEVSVNNGYIMDGSIAYEFNIAENGEITKPVSNSGTYLSYVFDENQQENKKSAIITVKNEKPDMTKKVKDRTTEDWKQEADYNFGDMVPYKITIDVPSNITKLKEFTLTDTPTNLQDSIQTNPDTSESFIVKCGVNPITNETGKVIYAVTRSGANGFEIKFTPFNMSEYAGKKIVIEYNAKLLDGAVTTTVGNPNTAKLEYSNKILPETDDESNPNKPNPIPEKDSIEDSAIVYTFNLKISKKADSVNGKSLGGVKFDLYKYTGTEPNPTEADLKGTDGKLLKGGLETSSENTNRGTVSYPGLANGIYYLVETKTVDGYNLLKEPVKVTLNITYKTSMSDSWSWVNNNGTSTLVKHKIDNSKTEFSGNDTSTPTYVTHTETIINKNGFTLPTTGGMGTVIFSVLGIALVLAGLLVISASRKKAAK